MLPGAILQTSAQGL